MEVDGSPRAAYAGGLQGGVDMRTRRLRWIAGLVLAVLVAIGAFVLWPQSDRVTRENFDRIREGMSRAQVEAILGPPGDYRIGPTVAVDPPEHLSTDPLEGERAPSMALERQFFKSWTYRWESDRVTVKVVFATRAESGMDEMAIAQLFDESFATVGVAKCECMTRQEVGPLDFLLWRAERHWRKCFPK
jgi:hypothetical protein